MKLSKLKELGLVGYYGVVHFLISITAVVVVSGIVGVGINLSFLMVGLGTIIFHIVTKNKIPAMTAISGSFIGACLLVSQTQGIEYVAGGVVCAGIVYLILGLLVKLKPNVVDFIPKHVMDMAVVIVALSLIPIGSDLASGNALISLVTIVSIILLSMNKKTRAFAMPLSILIGVLVQALNGGLTPQFEATGLAFIVPKFSLESVLIIGLTGLAVSMEMIGDMRNLSNATGLDLQREVGFHRILIGNGLSSIVSGMFGGGSNTTYSENVGVVYSTGYKNPNAQIVTALIYIAIAFIPQLSYLTSLIPQSALGCAILFLFILIMMNTLSRVKLDTENKVFTAIVIITLFYLAPIVLPNVSPIAVAMIGGLVVNKITNK